MRTENVPTNTERVLRKLLRDSSTRLVCMREINRNKKMRKCGCVSVYNQHICCFCRAQNPGESGTFKQLEKRAAPSAPLQHLFLSSSIFVLPFYPAGLLKIQNVSAYMFVLPHTSTCTKIMHIQMCFYRTTIICNDMDESDFFDGLPTLPLTLHSSETAPASSLACYTVCTKESNVYNVQILGIQ